MAKKKKEITESRAHASSDEQNLDISETEVKKLISKGKEKGYLTYNELAKVLSPEKFSSERIEDMQTMIADMGISLVDNDDEGNEVEDNTKTELSDEREEKNITTESELGRTDDPVRMYLREMGNVELLSREGEIAIAKQIEAGRDLMFRGISRNPLTLKNISLWTNELKKQNLNFRDVIDLEATYGSGPDGATVNNPLATAKVASTLQTKDNDLNKNEKQSDNDENDEETEDSSEDYESEETSDGMPSISSLEELLGPQIIASFTKLSKNSNLMNKYWKKSLDCQIAGTSMKSSDVTRFIRYQRKFLI